MRHYLRILALLATTAAIACGCSEETSLAPPTASPAPPTAPPAPPDPATAADLDAQIDERGSLTFLSNNGEWIGADNDAHLTFFPEGQVHLFQYGVAMTAYRGTYAIDEDGMVEATFPARQDPWPAMALQKDGESLLLIPQAPGGNPSPLPASWTYRPIPPEEEAAMRNEIATRGAN